LLGDHAVHNIFLTHSTKREREREGDMQNKERDMLGRKQERDVKWVKA
jgi:hypothetical protein